MKRNYNSIGIYSQSSGKVAKGAIDTTPQDALSGHRTNVLHINAHQVTCRVGSRM